MRWSLQNPPPHQEEWRLVPSKPGLRASSWGRVLLPQKTLVGFNGGTFTTQPRPRWGTLKKSRKNGQYHYLNIQCGDFGNVKVHQAVCEAWHGPKPFEEALVLHLDEDSTNNTPWNLKWGTHQENMNFPKYKLYLRQQMLDRLAQRCP